MDDAQPSQLAVTIPVSSNYGSALDSSPTGSHAVTSPASALSEGREPRSGAGNGAAAPGRGRGRGRSRGSSDRHGRSRSKGRHRSLSPGMRRRHSRKGPAPTPTLRRAGSYHQVLYSSAPGRRRRLSRASAVSTQEDVPVRAAPVDMFVIFENPLPTRTPSIHVPVVKSLAAVKSVEEQEEEEDNKNLPTWRLLMLAGISVPINVGWAVGEALIVPKLLELGVSKSLASLVFLIDPCFGVFLQPIAGIMSDRCRSSLGRRRPFLLTFTFTVCAGFMLVMFGQALAQAIVPVHTPLALIAVIMFAGYGTLDLSADLLVTPGRSILMDRASESQVQKGAAWWSAFANLGRFAGLATATLPLQSYAPFSSWGWDHLRCVFMLATVLFVLYNGIVSMVTSEKTLAEKEAEWKAEEAEAAAEAEVARAAAERAVHTPLGHGGTVLYSVSKDAGTPEAGAAVAAPGHGDGESDLDEDSDDDDDSDGDAEPSLTEAVLSLLHMPRDVFLVFIVQSAGWIAFLVQCFYWTSYVPEVSFKAQPNTPEFNEGVRWGTLTMAAESLAAFFLGYLLPLVNHKLGTRRVFYFTQIYSMLVIVAMLFPAVQTKWGSMAVCLLVSPLSAVQGDNAYVLVEECVRPRDRARYVAVLNLSMVICQILTAVGAAGVLALTGSLVATMVIFSSVGLVLTVVTMVYEMLFVRPTLADGPSTVSTSSYRMKSSAKESDSVSPTSDGDRDEVTAATPLLSQV